VAVLGRLLVSSAERLDLPDLLSIDSYSAGDWKFFIQTLVGEDKPYIIKGFEIIDPASAIGTQNCSIGIADSAMYYPGSAAGSFFYGLPAGNPNALPLVPELRKNATNYVYLVFSTFDTAEDTRAFWDPDANGNVGAEFTQEVNTESVIKVQVNVSTGAFPDNTVPIAIVKVGPSVITSIEDARPMMFRLGTGGISPNPSARFVWPAIPSNVYERQETPNTLTSPSGPNPFEGGDKNLLSLKEWMDAIMTKLAELSGGQFWYEDMSTFNMISIFNDLNITFKSKGKYIHSSATPGLLSWTEDLIIKSTNSPTDIVIRGPDSITIPNEYVAYLSLVRAQPINVLDQAVLWANGSAFINSPTGSIGFFNNLNIGDWVKKIGDNYVLGRQVVQFYDGIDGGSVTTPANAKSVLLSGNYLGTSGIDFARHDQGVYLASDIKIQARSNPAIAAAGGNFLWLVLRSDTIESIGSISEVAVTGTLSMVDGSESSPTGAAAKVIATGHGLVDGDRITVTAPAGQAGTYSVDVVDANTFFINTTNASVGAFTGFYGLATTIASATESANNGFESGETIGIAGTVNFNGEYIINRRSGTQFEFPMGVGGPPSPPPGSPNLATSSGFAILAYAAITGSTGAGSVITGDMGIYPNNMSSITNFPPSTDIGIIHAADSAAQQALIDATSAFTAMNLLNGGATAIPSVLDGQTVIPGVYKEASGTFNLAASGPGTLTFNGAGVYIFLAASTLVTGAGGMPTFAFTGGATPTNTFIYWAVGSAATLNVGVSSSGATFYGTVIASAAITATQAGTINGRLFSLNAAVTLSATNAVTVAGAGPAVPESVGTATLARLDVRSEEGITKVVQGETIDIGEGDSDNLQRFIGMSSLAEIHPVYFVSPGFNTLWNLASYNASETDNLTVRTSKLTAMMADKAQDKTLKYLCNATTATNTASGPAQVLTFQPASSSLVILQPGSPGNATVSLPTPGPAISLLANQSAYVVINRNASSTPTVVIANNANVPIDENVVVIASRLGDANIYLWNGERIIGSAPLVPGGAALIKVQYYDPVSSSLPTGNPVTEDGASVQAGDLVLFSALSSGNNRVYMANGTGTNITSWTVQFSFNGAPDPTGADTVIVQKGNGFKDQMGKFNDTTWVFNDKVRYFNGTDYFEQDALAATALADNTINGTVFSVSYVGSEYQIVDFSISRGAARETGTLYITSDGVNVSVTSGGAYIGSSGIFFNGVISGGNIILRYTSTATGSSATMKFMVRRWSNAAGGPNGVPSYTGLPGGGGVAGGTTGDIQFNNGGALDGNSNFQIDLAAQAVVLGGLQQTILDPTVPAVLVDNMVAPTLLISYDKTLFPFAIIEFSILRNGVYRVGRLMIANDGTNTAQSYDFVETGVTGVVLSSAISGSNVVVNYTSTSTGFNAAFKYFMRRWS
jgi:hypothetical protein